ncbi:MAG: hypothetical protein C0424_06020 [Sphingobacteriaceae bacterium]|nr:hypothetical protein [Sphingobacteriaceae bacterium]
MLNPLLNLVEQYHFIDQFIHRKFIRKSLNSFDDGIFIKHGAFFERYEMFFYPSTARGKQNQSF